MTLLLEHFDTLLTTPADVDALNRAILTLAVQGKLVAQDPDDEPASELPQNKQTEKINELPNGWAKRKLGDVCNIARGGSPRPIQKFMTTDHDGINWIKIGDTKNVTKYITSTAEKIIPEGAKFSRMVFEGDFILSNSMSFGRPYIMKTTGCIHDGWLVLQEIDPKISPDYLYYLLGSDFIFRQFDKLAAGSTVRNLNSALVRGVEITIPPLAEQKRIVARVDALFAQTRTLAAKLARAESDQTHLNQSALHHLLATESPEEFEKQWAFLAAHFETLFTRPEHIAPLRQSILELAVRGKLTRREAGDESAKELLKRIKVEKQKLAKKEISQFVKENEKPFDAPKGWEWVRLEELLLSIQAGTSFLADGRPALAHEYGVLKVSAVSWGKFLPDENKTLLPGTEFRKEFSVKKDDLLISRANTAELVGAVVLVDKDYPNLLLSDKTLRLDLSSELYKSYFVFALRASWIRKTFASEAIGTSSSMRNISQDKIRSALIAIPPLAEQARIVARVEQLLGLCDALESRLRAAWAERGRLVESVLVLSSVEGLAGSVIVK